MASMQQLVSQRREPFTKEAIWNDTYYFFVSLAENIMSAHHYTSTVAQTAAVSVNAGTCLEDANYYDNTFNHIGDAVSMVMKCTV